jgi:hypothetical protein
MAWINNSLDIVDEIISHVAIVDEMISMIRVRVRVP